MHVCSCGTQRICMDAGRKRWPGPPSIRIAESSAVHLSKVRKFGAKLEYMDVIMNRETASGEQTSAAVRPKKVGQGNGFGIAAVTEARACEAAACWNT